jgi:hypothetical protein
MVGKNVVSRSIWAGADRVGSDELAVIDCQFFDCKLKSTACCCFCFCFKNDFCHSIVQRFSSGE